MTSSTRSLRETMRPRSARQLFQSKSPMLKTHPSEDVEGIAPRMARMPWMAAAFRVLGSAARILSCVGHLGMRASVKAPCERLRRTTKKDFCDALYHLDQLAYADREDDEQREAVE